MRHELAHDVRVTTPVTQIAYLICRTPDLRRANRYASLEEAQVLSA